MSWFDKLKGALTKTSSKISTSLSDIVNKRKLGSDSLEDLEEILLSSDLGVNASHDIIAKIGQLKFDKEISFDSIKEELARVIADNISTHQRPFTLIDDKLNIILVCGVNGNGKTTTIGKLAHLYKLQGKSVAIAACDTFRAAAVEQLQTWGQRSKCEVITGAANSDPASVAYAAVEQSLSKGVDLLFIDTAGRLHSHKNLMEELAKIIKVIKKLDHSAPHHTLLVVDATTGQNAYNQVQHFGDIAGVDGLVVTKLDGTAKAGVVVGLGDKFKIPVHFIGLGEGIEDLKSFDAKEFAEALVG
jgi:fused signal recognition particle receptor